MNGFHQPLDHGSAVPRSILLPIPSFRPSGFRFESCGRPVRAGTRRLAVAVGEPRSSGAQGEASGCGVRSSACPTRSCVGRGTGCGRRRSRSSCKFPPGILQNPGGSCKVPGAFPKIPRSSCKIPRSFCKIPGSFRNIPAAFSKIPAAFRAWDRGDGRFLPARGGILGRGRIEPPINTDGHG